MKATGVKIALEEFDRTMAGLGGCGDGNCVVKRPTGMHTNGGCQCYHNHRTARRAMTAMRALRDALAETVEGRRRCKQCYETFNAERSTKLFCSPRCRVAFNRWNTERSA